MDCIFCKIAAGEIPAPKIYEDDLVFVIDDINPKAPVHSLVIPKEHIPYSSDLTDDHGPILAAMMKAAKETAKIKGTDEQGYRLLINNGKAAGQEVFHLHMHILGGKDSLGPMLAE